MTKILSLGFALAVVACSSSKTPPPAVDAPSGPTPIAIKMLRQNPPAAGAAVALKDVVVIAHVSSSKFGHVWVQDQGGGMFSGIHLFCNYGGMNPNCMHTQAQIDALAIGSVISVNGFYSSFLPTSAPPGAVAQIELDAPQITVGAGTMTPAAMDVTVDMVAKDQLLSANAKAFHGSYVKVTGGPFPVSSAMPAEFQRSCTSAMGVAGTTYGGFEATAGGKTLAVGLNFYQSVTYCIPACGFPCTNPIATQNFTSVTGIIEPDFNTANGGSVYLKISPTSDADLPHS